MILEFKGFVPVVHSSSYVHPLAVVTGNVIIGKNVYIGPGAALRGDWGGIVVKDGCNVQENCTIHMFPGVEVVLEENAHIGHGAVIHGAHIGKNCLIVMNSVVMDDVEMGEGCIIGAMSFVAANTTVEPRSLMVGNPARKIREVSDEMLDWKSKGTELYQTLPREMMEEAKECEPLTEIPENRPSQESLFETWNAIKNGK